jgi:hypothetical protein
VKVLLASSFLSCTSLSKPEQGHAGEKANGTFTDEATQDVYMSIIINLFF